MEVPIEVADDMTEFIVLARILTHFSHYVHFQLFETLFIDSTNIQLWSAMCQCVVVKTNSLSAWSYNLVWETDNIKEFGWGN